MSGTGEYNIVRFNGWKLFGTVVMALGGWLIITVTVVFVAIVEGNAIKDATIITLKEELGKLNKRDDSSAKDRNEIHGRLERLEQGISQQQARIEESLKRLEKVVVGK